MAPRSMRPRALSGLAASGMLSQRKGIRPICAVTRRSRSASPAFTCALVTPNRRATMLVVPLRFLGSSVPRFQVGGSGQSPRRARARPTSPRKTEPR